MSETCEDHQSHSRSTARSPESTSYGGGGFFANSRNFTVTGGTFISITKNYTAASTPPSGVRAIPLGDIDLLREIRVDNDSSVIDRQRQLSRVRRLYSAKLNGRKSSTTVAMYQGDGTEEEWRRDIAKYMSVRHPNIIQICGTASSGNIHATIFHDDLIPFNHFLELHRHSHFSTVHIYTQCNMDFEAARDYFYFSLQHWLYHHECTFWIRRSTTRLCVDLVPGGTMDYWYAEIDGISGPQQLRSLDGPNPATMVIESLGLDQYHEICYWDLSKPRYMTSNSLTVNFGAVFLHDVVEIAFLPDAEPGNHGIVNRWGISGPQVAAVTENGWTRLDSGDVNTTIQLDLRCRHSKSWLSQANSILTSLQITSNFEDYVVAERVRFNLTVSTTSADLSPGFLFICPPEDFHTEPSSFGWPECLAYWSLDPSGANCLAYWSPNPSGDIGLVTDLEDASDLVLPSITIEIEIWGKSWDAAVYAGLRQFHQAKGFDPEGLGVARYLGHSIFQLSPGRTSMVR